MLPLAHRLRTEEVKEVFRTGKSLFVMGIGVRFCKNERQVTQFAFVCGKKVVQGAVRRNRCKRLLRSVVWSLQKKWPRGYTIVVFVAQKQDELSRERFEKALSDIFEKFVK